MQFSDQTLQRRRLAFYHSIVLFDVRSDRTTGRRPQQSQGMYGFVSIHCVEQPVNVCESTDVFAISREGIARPCCSGVVVIVPVVVVPILRGLSQQNVYEGVHLLRR